MIIQYVYKLAQIILLKEKKSFRSTNKVAIYFITSSKRRLWLLYSLETKTTQSWCFN